MARWAEVTEAAKNLQILELEVGESVSGPESSSACEPNLVLRNQNTEPAVSSPGYFRSCLQDRLSHFHHASL